jgi:hypothetical protein
MGNFQVGPKVLVVNDPAVAPLRFFSRFADGEYNIVEAGDDFGVSGATGFVAVPTNATNLFTKAAHGMLNGTVVQLTTVTTLPTGLSLATNYYIVQKTVNTFKFALTEGGAVVTFSDDGTGDHTVTPAFGSLSTSPDTQAGEGASFNPVGADEVAANTDIADADMMEIVGFGRFEKLASDRNAVQTITGAKAVSAQAQASTITVTEPGTLTPGTTTIIAMKFASSGLIGEFASWFSDYKKVKYYNIDTVAGDSVTTIADRFVATVQQDLDGLVGNLIRVSNVAGVITIICLSDQIYVESVVSSGIDVAAGDLAFAWAIVVAWYGGRNTWEQIKSMRLQTSASVHPYTQEQISDQIPLKNAKYSSYLLSMNWNRPDLQGGTVMNQSISGSSKFHVFVNEASGANYILALAAWCNQTSGATLVQYTSTTPAGVLGGDATGSTIA